MIVLLASMELTFVYPSLVLSSTASSIKNQDFGMRSGYLFSQEILFGSTAPMSAGYGQTFLSFTIPLLVISKWENKLNPTTVTLVKPPGV